MNANDLIEIVHDLDEAISQLMPYIKGGLFCCPNQVYRDGYCTRPACQARHIAWAHELAIEVGHAARRLLDLSQLLSNPLAVPFWRNVRKSDGCWEWTGPILKRPDGVDSYGAFTVSYRKRVLAHRFAYELACGPAPAGKEVRHNCDNPKCVRPEHLEIGTQAENLADMRRRGRAYFNCFKKGSEHPNAKLDADTVAKIRKRRMDGLTLKAIGAEFRLDPSTVHDIVLRRTWRQVTTTDNADQVRRAPGRGPRRRNGSESCA